MQINPCQTSLDCLLAFFCYACLGVNYFPKANIGYVTVKRAEMYVYKFVCVCVCEREREREKEVGGEKEGCYVA